MPVAIPYGIASLHAAYKQRMRIEEMFRDCKSGGYNLEGSGLRGDRLIKMILLMAIVYTAAIFQGTEIHKKQVQKYSTFRCYEVQLIIGISDSQSVGNPIPSTSGQK